MRKQVLLLFVLLVSIVIVGCVNVANPFNTLGGEDQTEEINGDAGGTNGATNGATNGTTNGDTGGSNGTTNGATNGATNGDAGDTNGATNGTTNGDAGGTNGTGGDDVSTQTNVITDGDFASGTLDYWDIWADEGGVATHAYDNGTAAVAITDPGTEAWHVQFLQDNLNVPDGNYELTFRARAEAPRTIQVNFGKGLDADPWFAAFMEPVPFNVTTTWQEFSHTIQKSSAYNDGKLVFELGQVAGDNLTTTVYLDDIRLVVTEPNDGGNDGSSAEYTLVWSDEFDGSEIDTSVWRFDIGTGDWGWGNNESQYYTDRPENAYVENGMLYIVARYEENYGNGKDYTSARLNTEGTKSFQYGRIEARIKAPHNPDTGEMDPGVWPAFWMLGDNYSDVGWPYSGEIDIWESGGSDPRHVSGAVHYSGTHHPEDFQHLMQTRTIDHSPPLHHNFHVYAIEWDDVAIAWYIDDIKVGEWFHGWLADSAPNPFNQAFWLLLNVAIEGNYYFSGTANPDNYPQQMMVDYVRVYQKN